MATIAQGGDGCTKEGAGLRRAGAGDGFPWMGQEAQDLVEEGSSDGWGEIQGRRCQSWAIPPWSGAAHAHLVPGSGRTSAQHSSHCAEELVAMADGTEAPRSSA